MIAIDTRTKLSALWLFILLNIIFRDIHQYVLASHLEMLLTGYYKGIEVTDELILLGGFLVEIPIAMVLFSLLLTCRVGRSVTIIAAVLTTGTLLSAVPTDMDDWFHLIIEMAAWTWTKHDQIAV